MQVKPCLHPKRVYNSTLGEYHNVPCGHCAACLCSKGFRLSERLGEALAQYSFKYFVTLTFSDDFLPIAKYDENLGSFVHPYDYNYNGVMYSVSVENVEQSLSNKDFENSFVKYQGVPCLSRRLLINFKKRFRKNFSKFYDGEKVFIYAVGEYGPTTLRPHYHLLFGTNAKCTASLFEMCVRQSWSLYDKTQKRFVCEYGRIDFQRVISNGARNYVAQYLNCFTALPSVYSRGDFRPFYQSSSFTDSELVRYEGTSLGEMFSKCSPETSCVSLQDNSQSYVKLPQFVINRVFPKCYKFSSLAFCDRVQLYSVFEKQPFLSAKEFADNVINCFGGSSDIFGFVKSLAVDNDYMASKTRLIRLFYVSRRVCKNAFILHVSLEQYVQRIELFWSRYELLKLKEFYELQESLLMDNLNPISVADLLGLYYDTDDSIRHLGYYVQLFNNPSFLNNIDFIPKQRSFSNLMCKIISDTSKTKKRNDYFDKKGFKRPSFYSKLKIKKSWLEYSQI